MPRFAITLEGFDDDGGRHRGNCEHFNPDEREILVDGLPHLAEPQVKKSRHSDDRFPDRQG